MTIGEFCKTVGKAGADLHTIAAIRSLLEECDQARFAPMVPDQHVVDTALQRASAVIENLNQQLESRG
jgi:hypothetical protein